MTIVRTYLPAGMTPCAGCGTAIEASRADYDPQGNLICAPCASRGDLERIRDRTRLGGGGLAVAAFAAALLALLPIAVYAIT